MKPDYAGLVELLLVLRHLPDATALVTLRPDEVERVRSLGFQAEAGIWQVPPLPATLVVGNPLLEALGDDRDPFWRPRQSNSESNHQTFIAEQPGEPPAPDNARVQDKSSEATIPASESECSAILAAVERAGGTIDRRKLQKKLWRIKAVTFNQSLESLSRRGLISVEGNLVVAQRADQAEPALFHGVPQTNQGVPPDESAPDLPRAGDRVNGFRTYPPTQHRKEGG